MQRGIGFHSSIHCPPLLNLLHRVMGVGVWGGDGGGGLDHWVRGTRTPLTSCQFIMSCWHVETNNHTRLHSHVHVFELWKDTKVPRGTPHRHRENMRHTVAQYGPSVAEERTPDPTYRETITVKQMEDLNLFSIVIHHLGACEFHLWFTESSLEVVTKIPLCTLFSDSNTGLKGEWGNRHWLSHEK